MAADKAEAAAKKAEKKPPAPRKKSGATQTRREKAAPAVAPTAAPTTAQEEGEFVAPSVNEQMMQLQMRMFAVEHLKSIRPKAKFGGGKRLDFAKQMKLFQTAMDTPGVTLQNKMLEFQHYFEGTALQLIEADLMHADQEMGFAFAVSRLTQKFGKRRETALEQLDEVLAGKQLPEKDAGALLEFWGKLASIHALAVETNRANE